MSILEKINSSADIKKLDREQLPHLCDELRKFEIENIAKTGGHLSPNLGTVELTVAIHRVYDTEKDRLVFDVGHQSYTHKFITGRRDRFDTLRQYGGLSGFPKPSESNDDAFIAGHASNSVSVALGMARARTLTGGEYDVVSVIGGWFGRDWSIVPHLGTIHIGSIAIDLPLNLLEGNNPLYVLIAAICLGAIHLALGTGIGIYLKLKDGEWADALLNDLCWWVMIAGILVMVTGGTKIVLFVGIGMLVLGQLITGKGFGKITGIFGAVYNGATGYLGDLLSYSRLMALMLAGSVIASVFNQLGSLGNANGMTVGGTILFVLVFCIGHALNFALNLIGCFVHTLRLQFLEFFGKWYRDGGKAFRPLKIQTKYVDIKEE